MHKNRKRSNLSKTVAVGKWQQDDKFRYKNKISDKIPNESVDQIYINFFMCVTNTMKNATNNSNIFTPRHSKYPLPFNYFDVN